MLTNSPYVLNILDTLSDINNLYLITNISSCCIPLSNLLDYVSINGGIQEKHIICITSCVLSVLKYCHNKNIIHRGIHPDSLLIEPNCYVKVADWGFAKIVTDRTYTLCGHVEYLSPEAICGETGYGRGVDYWALGVLIFEMLVGRSAFAPIDNNTSSHFHHTTSSNTNTSHDSTTIDNILSCDPLFPTPFPHPAKSIIQSLCAKSISQRLGCIKGGKGIEDIMSHIWFKQNGGIDWVKLDKGELPLLPQLPLEIFPNSSSSSTSSSPSSSGAIPLETLFAAPEYTGYYCHDWDDFRPSLSSKSYENKKIRGDRTSSTPTSSSTSGTSSGVNPNPGIHRRDVSHTSITTSTQQNHPSTPYSTSEIFSLYSPDDSHLQTNPLRRSGNL